VSAVSTSSSISHDNYPQTIVIVITAHATTDSAIDAVHYHVFEYIRKPFEFSLFKTIIEKAFQKLEIEELRQATTAMITHDIKIPLTSIIGFAAMMVDPETGKFHARAREFVETIQANGQKVLELIENFLATSKIEAGSFRITPVEVDPEKLLHDIIETGRLEAGRRNIMIEHVTENLPLGVCLDEVLVFRALGNLLQNSIKYCAGRESILVQAGQLTSQYSPIHEETLYFRVVNDVKEILPGQFDGVFNRYGRGLTGQAGIEGSGIGLFVVHAVAQAHGGDITIDTSDPGHVRFTLYLPLNLKPRGNGRP
jgi:signal transduction histidine kinase